MWALDLNDIINVPNNELARTQNPVWTEIKTQGSMGCKVPKPIANHTSCVYGNTMYMFGGSGGMCENTDLYALDMDKYSWEAVKPRAMDGDEDVHFPVTRDEHSCCVL